MLHLIDGMNIARRLFENYGSSQAAREVVYLPRTITAADQMIWCWDSPNGSSARRKIYPNYKMNRTAPVSAFPEMVKWIKELLTYTNCFQATVPGYEADDIIAYFACKTTQPVRIKSNDRDFCQLLVLPHVQCEAQPKDGLHPKYVRLFKTVVGDPSDNVGGFPGFGAKSWQKLVDGKHLDQFQSRVQKIVQGLALTQVDRDWLAEVGLPKKVVTFMVEEPDQVRALWAIIGFMPLNDAQVLPSLILGNDNPLKIEQELGRFQL